MILIGIQSQLKPTVNRLIVTSSTMMKVKLFELVRKKAPRQNVMIQTMFRGRSRRNQREN